MVFGEGLLTALDLYIFLKNEVCSSKALNGVSANSFCNKIQKRWSLEIGNTSSHEKFGAPGETSEHIISEN